MSRPPRRNPQSLTAIIWILGLGQLVGFGTIFYSFALVAPGPSAEFGVTLPTLFAVLSAAMLASGFVGPRIGRLIDSAGGPTVMAAGSIACGVIFLGLATSANIWIFAALIILLQTASVAVLYGASAPTLTQFGGPNVQRAIVLMTLIMGMSSTLFWPIIGWLMPNVGWRWTYAIFGLLHFAIALPCHLWLRSRLKRRRAADPVAAEAPDIEPMDTGAVLPVDRRFAFWAVTISFSLSSLIGSALAVHLVPVLEGIGLASSAYVISMLMGPAQVSIRLGQTLFFRTLHPLFMAMVTATFLPLSVLCLVSGAPPIIAGIVFTMIYGIAQGFTAIVSGTLPLVLFGRYRYGELLGRITMYRAIFGAPAPFILSALWAALGLTNALLILAAVGGLALAPLLMLRSRMRTTTP